MIKQQGSLKTVAVAVAEDHEVIEAVAKAIKLQLAQFRLYGNQEKIMGMLQEHGLQTSEHVQVIAAMSSAEAAELSVKAVRNGEADVLMKGNIPTANILKAVLNKEWGLRKGSVLSHVAAFEVPNYDRLIFVTDAAMNIAPDVTQKAAIIQKYCRSCPGNRNRLAKSGTNCSSRSCESSDAGDN